MSHKRLSAFVIGAEPAEIKLNRSHIRIETKDH